LRQPASAILRNSAIHVAGISQRTAQRGYVTETPKNNASVNVDTTIRADQKAFFAETGKLPENVIVPGSNIEADAMMSPMAGVYLMSDPIDRAQTKFA
jgi:cysteine desulfurase